MLSTTASSTTRCARCAVALPPGGGRTSGGRTYCCFHCRDNNPDGHSRNCCARGNITRAASRSVAASASPASPPRPPPEPRRPAAPMPGRAAYEDLIICNFGGRGTTIRGVGEFRRPPLAGWEFLFFVANRDDNPQSLQIPESALHRLDCRFLSDIHLINSAGLEFCHDGRHPGIQALFFNSWDWDAAEMSLWKPLITFLQTWAERGESCKTSLQTWWLFCNAGRHRSMSCAVAYARVLAWLGAFVEVACMNRRRLCGCELCMGSPQPPLELLQRCVGALDDKLERSRDDDVSHRLAHLIEFTDTVPLQRRM